MKISIFLILVWCTNTWGLSLSCPQRDAPRLDYPLDSVEWIIDRGDDGIDGLMFKIKEGVNELDFLSASLLIPGKTEADYLIPLKVDVHSGVVNAGFYVPKSELSRVIVKLVYGEQNDLCGTKQVIYSLSYAKSKT